MRVTNLSWLSIFYSTVEILLHLAHREISDDLPMIAAFSRMAFGDRRQAWRTGPWVAVAATTAAMAGGREGGRERRTHTHSRQRGREREENTLTHTQPQRCSIDRSASHTGMAWLLTCAREAEQTTSDCRRFALFKRLSSVVRGASGALSANGIFLSSAAIFLCQAIESWIVLKERKKKKPTTSCSVCHAVWRERAGRAVHHVASSRRVDVILMYSPVGVGKLVASRWSVWMSLLHWHIHSRYFLSSKNVRACVIYIFSLFLFIVSFHSLFAKLSIFHFLFHENASRQPTKL